MAKKKKSKSTKITVKPKKKYVNWIIPLPGGARFQPATVEHTIILDGKHRDALKENPYIIIEEDT